MICIYEQNATDFSTNGLGALYPTSCKVSATLNGEYELELEHPYDEYGKWRRIMDGRIIRAPVPTAMTPRIAQQETTGDTLIYRVSTGGQRLALRTEPRQSGTMIWSYANGTEVIVIDNTTHSTWYEVVTPDGRTGWMYRGNLTYVRTETSSADAEEAVIEARQLRDQPFRIYSVTPTLDRITVRARHIFYDLLDNMIRSYTPGASDTGATVVAGISSHCETAHSFTFYSDLTGTANLTGNQDALDFQNVNPAEALLGGGGVCELFSGEVVRDWWDVYVVRRVGRSKPIEMRYGKNLLGVSAQTDSTAVVTRIMPTGQKSNGTPLYLPEVYIDSPYINAYPHPKWSHLPVDDARVQSGMTEAQALARMREAAQTEFANGCDRPTVSVSVDFIDLSATEEYKEYEHLQGAYIGDAVTVYVPHIDMAITLRVTAYTYDCLTRQYLKLTLGKNLMSLAYIGEGK